MSALLTLNIERFLALTRPFFHQNAITKAKLALFVAIQMIIIAILTLLYWFYREKSIYGPISATVIGLLFLFALTFTNYKMLIIVKTKRQEELRAAPLNIATPGHQKRRKRNFKNVSTCFLVVGCFFICSFTKVVSVIWNYTSKTPINDSQSILFSIRAYTCVCMNSTFNCLIFFWRNSILRREGMKIVKCLRTEIP